MQKREIAIIDAQRICYREANNGRVISTVALAHSFAGHSVHSDYRCAFLANLQEGRMASAVLIIDAGSVSKHNHALCPGVFGMEDSCRARGCKMTLYQRETTLVSSSE
jgi:hypothetical protein